AALSGLQQTSIGKRRGELRDSGFVRATDRQRRAPSGAMAIVWEAVPEDDSLDSTETAPARAVSEDSSILAPSAPGDAARELEPGADLLDELDEIEGYARQCHKNAALNPHLSHDLEHVDKATEIHANRLREML